MNLISILLYILHLLWLLSHVLGPPGFFLCMLEVRASIIIKFTSLIVTLHFESIPKLDALLDSVMCLLSLVVGISL